MIDKDHARIKIIKIVGPKVRMGTIPGKPKNQRLRATTSNIPTVKWKPEPNTVRRG